jgi:hypothetical protein
LHWRNTEVIYYPSDCMMALATAFGNGWIFESPLRCITTLRR